MALYLHYKLRFEFYFSFLERRISRVCQPPEGVAQNQALVHVTVPEAVHDLGPQTWSVQLGRVWLVWPPGVWMRVLGWCQTLRHWTTVTCPGVICIPDLNPRFRAFRLVQVILVLVLCLLSFQKDQWNSFVHWFNH